MVQTVDVQLALTKEDFIFIDYWLRKWGYQKDTKLDSDRTFERLALLAPRTLIGKEASYRYTKNGYTVIIHTTFIEAQELWRPRGTDAGWALIAEGDIALYFARPFKRIKGYVLKLLRYAWVTKWKVDNRPLCPKCQGYMNIHRKKNSRSYFWICKNQTKHDTQKPEFLNWDYGLPTKAQEFVEERRQISAEYKKRNKKAGKTPRPAATLRKPWIVRKPENLLSIKQG